LNVSGSAILTRSLEHLRNELFNRRTRLELINSLGVKDNTGAYINPDSYAQNLTYNADGTIATVHFTDGANTWI
jgi:hypothetical protein